MASAPGAAPVQRGEWAARFLGWAAPEPADEPAPLALSNLSALRRWVLVLLAGEAWLALRFDPYAETPGRFGLVATALTLCALAAWRRPAWERAAAAVAAVLVGGVVAAVFPQNANHQWLAIVFLLLLALPSAASSVAASAVAAREAADALCGVRWIAMLGTGWAGVQKLFYGSYFGAEFLSFRIARDPAFAALFSWIVPPSEVHRLQSLGSAVGAGPFRADAPLLVVVSNLTWMLELALPLLLFWPRTRRYAWPVAVLFFAALQLGARELFFALLMIGPFLTFSSRGLVQRLLPLEVAIVFLWILLPDIAPGWRIR